MHLREPRLRLLARVVEALVVVLGLELRKFCVERGFFAEKRVAPNVGLEDGVDGGRVVSDDLRELVLSRRRYDVIRVPPARRKEL